MARKAAVKSRLDRNKKRQGRSVIVLAWLRRFGFGLAIFTLALWLGAWFFLSDAAKETGAFLRKEILTASAEAGFSVQDMMVEGRIYADPDVIRGLVNMQPGDPLFAFDPVAAKELLEQVAWVKEAKVQRRLPGTIYVSLTERIPLALWQEDKKTVLIDTEGVVITDYNLARFENLVLVRGREANEHAPPLLEMVAAEPLVAERLAAAQWVSGRRWDLTLKNGIVVKLPEEEIGLALRRLAASQEKDGLLERDIKNLDLRENDRIVVRTKPGGVQDYQAGLKL